MNQENMSINQRIDNKLYTEDDLLQYLDSTNPILLYKVSKIIVEGNMKKDRIIEKLFDIAVKLEEKDSILGYYKIGHLAMSNLMKLGMSSDEVFSKMNLNEFEKKSCN